MINKSSYNRIAIVFFFWILLIGLSLNLANAQTIASTDKTIDAATRTALLEEAIRLVKEHYVFPEMAEKVAADIQTRMQNKEYDSITSAIQFTDKLTKDLRSISKDKHLYVRLMTNNRAANPFAPELARMGNYGLSKAEILPNNIGYLKINEFPPPDMVAPALAAAMKFLSNTDALIIDLRDHRGGAVPTVAMTVSYFIPEKRVQLLTISSPRNKGTNSHGNESWTLEKVDGPRYLDRPVYLLTSSRTFSGGEEFAYDMQALKRATLIGETTGGGANPVRLFPVKDMFLIGVSILQVKHSITGTNWEGVGVKPEIETPVEQALQKAQELASKQIQEKKNSTQVTAQTPSPSSSSSSSPVTKLPETPAGKAFSDFLKAFNSGDLAVMKHFHTERGTPEKAANENAQQDFDFYQQSGGLTFHSVTESTDYSITIFVQSKKSGGWLKMRVSVDKSSPYPIADLAIQPASNPDGK